MRYTEKEFNLEVHNVIDLIRIVATGFFITPFRLVNEVSKKILFLGKENILRLVLTSIVLNILSLLGLIGYGYFIDHRLNITGGGVCAVSLVGSLIFQIVLYFICLTSTSNIFKIKLDLEKMSTEPIDVKSFNIENSSENTGFEEPSNIPNEFNYQVEEPIDIPNGFDFKSEEPVDISNSSISEFDASDDLFSSLSSEAKIEDESNKFDSNSNGSMDSIQDQFISSSGSIEDILAGLNPVNNTQEIVSSLEEIVQGKMSASSYKEEGERIMESNTDDVSIDTLLENLQSNAQINDIDIQDNLMSLVNNPVELEI